MFLFCMAKFVVSVFREEKIKFPRDDDDDDDRVITMIIRVSLYCFVM
jgi:hypothetical protein